MQRKPNAALKKSENAPHLPAQGAPSRASSLRSVERLLALCLFALFLSGCGYRLGPVNGNPAGSRSIQVNLFENKTWEPRLSEPLATALRRDLQRDGTFRLATKGDADIIVDGGLPFFRPHSCRESPGRSPAPQR